MFFQHIGSSLKKSYYSLFFEIIQFNVLHIDICQLKCKHLIVSLALCIYMYFFSIFEPQDNLHHLDNLEDYTSEIIFKICTEFITNLFKIDKIVFKFMIKDMNNL